jgi:hypothetical protein
MKSAVTMRDRKLHRMFLLCFSFLIFLPATDAQTQQPEEEIVANLAGGRVIVHVTRDNIVFAAIDQPIEANSIPPRVMDLDKSHVAVLFGASEWRLPADPKPVRLDRNFQRAEPKDPKFQSYSGEAEPDLESIGVAFLEKLRPLVSQLRHKIDFNPDEPLFEAVIIGYAPNSYGPEVWTVEFRIQQEEIATRGDYWQTHILRPRFEQLYPPEKKAPKILVEARYPADSKGPALQTLIESNDPRVARLRSGDQRFAKLFELIDKGQAQKAVGADAADFLRAVVPLIAPNARFVLATMAEDRGFEWVVEPEEPMEKAQEDKNRPPDAPTLRRKPKP